MATLSHSTGYRIMNNLVTSFEKGKGTKTAEDLLYMCDVYFGADRMTADEYNELVERINAVA